MYSIKCATYIMKLEAIKASTGRGVLLSQRPIIAEATPPVRNKNKEQDADHSSPL
jgi:hypothetical protein